jgi:hypothetical protein
MSASVPILESGDRVGDLEVPQDLAFQRRAWTFERIGWVAMALVLLAGIAGVWGEGPLAQAEAVSRDGSYSVEYARFARHQAPEAIRVTLTAGAAGQEARLSIDRDYADGMQVEEVYPEPESVEAGPDEVIYVFSLAEEGTAATVVFSVLYDDIGRNGGEITLEGHPPVKLSQFIYP